MREVNNGISFSYGGDGSAVSAGAGGGVIVINIITAIGRAKERLTGFGDALCFIFHYFEVASVIGGISGDGNPISGGSGYRQVEVSASFIHCAKLTAVIGFFGKVADTFYIGC